MGGIIIVGDSGTIKTYLLFSYPQNVRKHSEKQVSLKQGEAVLDIFLGSGSTLIAADQLGRICYGMGISPVYCQAILERYQSYCADSDKKCIIKINGEPFYAN
jgi:DNA modification methylase